MLRLKFDFSIPLLNRVLGHGEVMSVMSLIEQPGGDVDLMDSHGGTPLHAAAGNGHMDIRELLVFEFDTDVLVVEFEADPIAKAWDLALGGLAEIVRLLVELGAEKWSILKLRQPVTAFRDDQIVEMMELLVAEIPKIDFRSILRKAFRNVMRLKILL
ncbi:hypothetical protein BC938DRAFT_476719 [Jimgerdemannia flammicorona]|uniref:Uncharacterized protein n=1 Tax=Jimgerdemannia flammicorona TaxID=994334 RepID=A0A433QQ75_9FUNG|nr:hypothetical protein BC938DRAFT_476719 [Jimgerdemannia flammicorona]